MSAVDLDTPPPGLETPARIFFRTEGLAFPPLPELLEDALQPRGQSWFATRETVETPYGLDEFLLELEATPHLPDYAVVGFDGHGFNSWAVHSYLVTRSLALFVQMPWGGAFVEPGPAREEIAAIFGWTALLQAAVAQAEEAHTLPPQARLEVVASRFGRSGWRWIGGAHDPRTTPWNPAPGMLAATLQELAGLAGSPSLDAR